MGRKALEVDFENGRITDVWQYVDEPDILHFSFLDWTGLQVDRDNPRLFNLLSRFKPRRLLYKNRRPVL